MSNKDKAAVIDTFTKLDGTKEVSQNFCTVYGNIKNMYN